MNFKLTLATFLGTLLIGSMLLAGCAAKDPFAVQKEGLAEFSGGRTQGNIKLFYYAGDPSTDDIKEFSKTLGCNMLYAYFYPDTVPVSEIPVEEIKSAASFGEAYDVLYSQPGFASWHFVSRCFAAIPFVSDCYESPASQNCR